MFRLFFCPKDVQLRNFEAQMELVKLTGLPMFLHCRAAFDDFVAIMERHVEEIRSRRSAREERLRSGADAEDSPVSPGVVHSFTGTVAEAARLVELGFYIGLNGCSLRTPQGLQVARSIPRERILVETDAPYCDFKPSSAGSYDIYTIQYSYMNGIINLS